MELYHGVMVSLDDLFIRILVRKEMDRQKFGTDAFSKRQTRQLKQIVKESNRRN